MPVALSWSRELGMMYELLLLEIERVMRFADGVSIDEEERKDRYRLDCSFAITKLLLRNATLNVKPPLWSSGALLSGALRPTT